MSLAEFIASLPLRRRIPKEPVFYIYVYYDENYIPIYVGKGKGYRINNHRHVSRRGTRLTDAILSGRVFTSEKVEVGLTETEAFDAERKWIAKIGREAEGGTLWNLSSGGEGASGLIMPDEVKAALIARSIGRKPTEAVRLKMSLAKKGKKQPKEQIEKRALKLRGKKRPLDAIERTAAFHRGKRWGPQTPEQIAKAAAARTPHKWSVEERKAMSERALARDQNYYNNAAKSKRKAVICVETKDEFESGVAAARAFGIHTSAICQILKGARKSAGGYSFVYAEKI